MVLWLALAPVFPRCRVGFPHIARVRMILFARLTNRLLSALTHPRRPLPPRHYLMLLPPPRLRRPRQYRQPWPLPPLDRVA